MVVYYYVKNPADEINPTAIIAPQVHIVHKVHPVHDAWKAPTNRPPF